MITFKLEKVELHIDEVLEAVNKGVGGSTRGPRMAIVGPTREAPYGKIHEYGGRIKVTPKMRKYLHSVGIHMRKSTMQITLPPRPFMRPALMNAQAGFAEMFRNLLAGGDPALRKCALLVEGIAKKSMRAGGKTKGRDERGRFTKGVGVPSAPGQPPHVQEGTLRASITHAIIDGRVS